MDWLTLFGVLAVTSMLIFYALEERAPMFVLCFAGSCAASSAYGFLQGAWPFGLVEGVWTFVALRRWRRVTQTAAQETRPGVPIACDMTAFTPAERARYDQLRATVVLAVSDAVPTAAGLRVRVSDRVPPPEVLEWLALERRCCPFLDATLTLGADRTTWVALQGGPGVKAFLLEEFSGLLRPPTPR